MKPFTAEDATRLLPRWSRGRGPDGDVVFSTRLRLARNVSIAPFPAQASEEDLARVVQVVAAPFEASADFADFRRLAVETLDPVTRGALVERHIISVRLVEHPRYREAFVSPTGTLSVMVNEEDHVRMQCFLPGRDVKEGWAILDNLDDWLSDSIPWSFSPRFGYLSMHLANLGTGLRASAMLHLPGLRLMERRTDVLRAIARLGVAVRGLYGEGTDSAGDVLQVSNRFALGPSEEEIVSRVDSAVRHLVKAERQARDELYEGARDRLADAAWRAYGVLRYARCISTVECLDLLSELKLGLDLNLVNATDKTLVNELFLAVRPASLQAAMGRTLDAARRDRFRADLVRGRLGGPE